MEELTICFLKSNTRSAFWTGPHIKACKHTRQEDNYTPSHLQTSGIVHMPVCSRTVNEAFCVDLFLYVQNALMSTESPCCYHAVQNLCCVALKYNFTHNYSLSREVLCTFGTKKVAQCRQTLWGKEIEILYKHLRKACPVWSSTAPRQKHGPMRGQKKSQKVGLYIIELAF